MVSLAAEVTLSVTHGMRSRVIAALLVALPSAYALVGATRLAEATAVAPAQRLPPPEVSFQLDDDEAQADEDDRWRDLARRAAGLQQLECHEDLLGATTRMVDEAENGDSLAMAALGAMCTCSPRVTCRDRRASFLLPMHSITNMHIWRACSTHSSLFR